MILVKTGANCVFALHITIQTSSTTCQLRPNYHLINKQPLTLLKNYIPVRKKCRLDGCRNELLVLQDDQLILVKPNMMIEYDNYEYTVEQTSKICFQKNSYDVARLGNGIAIKSRKYNFTVLYSSEGDIKIGVSNF